MERERPSVNIQEIYHDLQAGLGILRGPLDDVRLRQEIRLNTLRQAVQIMTITGEIGLLGQLHEAFARTYDENPDLARDIFELFRGIPHPAFKKGQNRTRYAQRLLGASVNREGDVIPLAYPARPSTSSVSIGSTQS